MRLTEILKALRHWNLEVELRSHEMRRCARIWTVISYLIRIPILLLASVATMVMTISANEESERGEYTPLAITAIVVNSTSIFLAGIESALTARDTATKCSNCCKNYLELAKEISLDIDTLSLELIRSGDMDELNSCDSVNAGSWDGRDVLSNYRFIKAKYMNKQQAIFNEEPSSFFVRSRHMQKKLIEARDDYEIQEMDDKALIAMRQRTRKGSQWKVTRQAQSDEGGMSESEIVMP